ncbi:uncharacterized protein [Procambarus clarkii]
MLQYGVVEKKHRRVACVGAGLLLAAFFYITYFSPLLHQPLPPLHQPLPPLHQPLPRQPSSPDVSSNLTTNDENPPWWDGGRCRCDGKVCVPEKEVSKVSLDGVGGTCGRRAWAAGHKQRVVSYSVFGNNSEYWLGLDDLLVTIAHLYPEWVVRVYTIPQPTLAADFCPLLRRHPHLYICDVTNLPQPLGNISGLHPMMWRTAPLGDPQLTHLMVRDTDSQVSEREQAAVDAWLASGKPFHVMRDHPHHNVPILGGTWAARWDQDIINTSELITIRDLMLRDAVGTSLYGKDQAILKRRLWPVMTGRVLAHDSYTCTSFPGSVPWPTQRVDGFFVGSPRMSMTSTAACRMGMGSTTAYRMGLGTTIIYRMSMGSTTAHRMSMEFTTVHWMGNMFHFHPKDVWSPLYRPQDGYGVNNHPQDKSCVYYRPQHEYGLHC